MINYPANSVTEKEDTDGIIKKTPCSCRSCNCQQVMISERIHAYIPIFWQGPGKTDYAIAMDVNKGPLRKEAQENICAYKMEEQIETRLSDGFSPLKKYRCSLQ